MARKRFRKRRRGSRHSSIKKIVADEVNKTRETNKLVSYVGWSRLNDILSTNLPVSVNLPSPSNTVLCYSLTGGVDSTLDTTQNPGDYVAKQLFVMLPQEISPNTVPLPNLSGVASAAQAGMQSSTDCSGNAGGVAYSTAIANPHQLEGRSCFLKKFYATVALNNSATSVVDPTNVFVRCLVVQTRRPLSSHELGKQLLLQNHVTLEMNPSIITQATNFPCSALAYLNRDVITKVYYDKTFTLNGGGGATGSMKRFKIQVNINKKARWSYYYPSGIPENADNELIYSGPFLYMVMWAASSAEYSGRYNLPVAGNEGGGINTTRRPAVAISSILSYMDD